jgi:hypothetical protein
MRFCRNLFLDMKQESPNALCIHFASTVLIDRFRMAHVTLCPVEAAVDENIILY